MSRKQISLSSISVSLDSGLTGGNAHPEAAKALHNPGNPKIVGIIGAAAIISRTPSQNIPSWRRLIIPPTGLHEGESLPGECQVDPRTRAR